MITYYVILLLHFSSRKLVISKHESLVFHYSHVFGGHPFKRRILIISPCCGVYVVLFLVLCVVVGGSLFFVFLSIFFWPRYHMLFNLRLLITQLLSKHKQIQYSFFARIKVQPHILYLQGRCDRDHMVVRFTTTYVISAYHHRCCEFDPRSGREVHHYVIKFASDLRQIGGFSGSSGFLHQ